MFRKFKKIIDKDQTEKNNAQEKESIVNQINVDIPNVSSTNLKKLVSTLSHEIRNPLNAIMGLSSTLKKEANSISKENKDLLEIIHNSGKTLHVITEKILDFIKIQAGLFTLNESEFNLNELFFQLIESNKKDVNVKNLKFQYFDTNLFNFLVFGDKFRLTQIFSYILENAIKFTEEGFIKIDCKILNISQNEIDIELIIEDSGTGISENNFDLIFQSFSQEDETITRRYGGLGLGLYICKYILGLMKGNIKVISSKDEGSKFLVELKLKYLGFAKSVNIKKNIKLNLEEVAKIKILLVEDDLSQQVYAKNVLKNWNLHIASNGKEAINILKEDLSFNIILMDLRMPVMDGIEATKFITKQLNLKIPVVAVSGEAFTENLKNECISAGMSDFVQKPYEDWVLIDCIIRNLKNINVVKTEDINFNEMLFGKKALLVEDNPVNQKITKNIFNSYNCSCDIAANGKLAIEMADKFEYDFILMDLYMDEMDGLDAAKILRYNGISIPIIPYSSDDNPEVIRKCDEAGMDKLLLKPPKNKHEFVLQIVEAIEKRKNEKRKTNSLYDFKPLSEKLGEFTDDFYDVVYTFLRKMPNDLNLLHQYFEEKNFVKLSRIAHTMKSSTLQFGIKITEKELDNIEYYESRNFSQEEIKIMIDTVSKYINQIISEMNEDIINKE